MGKCLRKWPLNQVKGSSDNPWARTKIPLKGHLDLDLMGEFFIITINLAGALSASISSILAYTSKENNQKILVIIVTTFQVKLKKFYKYGKFKFLIILVSRQ